MGRDWLPGAMDRLDGIEPHEVIQVLDAQKRWPRPARDEVTGLVALTIWGRTRAGRALMVVTRKLPGLDSQILMARDLTNDELAELEAWEATR